MKRQVIARTQTLEGEITCRRETSTLEERWKEDKHFNFDITLNILLARTFRVNRKHKKLLSNCLPGMNLPEDKQEQVRGEIKIFGKI